jgi:hypothetical protein
VRRPSSVTGTSGSPHLLNDPRVTDPAHRHGNGITRPHDVEVGRSGFPIVANPRGRKGSKVVRDEAETTLLVDRDILSAAMCPEFALDSALNADDLAGSTGTFFLMVIVPGQTTRSSLVKGTQD